MFGFLKSSEERKLIKLGYSEVLSDYKKQLRNKSISKEQYRELLQQLLHEHKDRLVNIDNVNVATRQSFIDDETLVSLNVSKIQVPEYDIDFIKNKIAFDYNNYNRLYASEINFLYQFFKTEFKDFIKAAAPLNIREKDLVDLITSDYSEIEASVIHQAFVELKEKLQ